MKEGEIIPKVKYLFYVILHWINSDYFIILALPQCNR